jgi:ethanolamine utilization protein EutQ (cupin superfamily)
MSNNVSEIPLQLPQHQSIVMDSCLAKVNEQLCREDLAHSAKASSCPPAVPMFQTAGKKSVIQVSDDSLSKASKLFDETTLRDSVTAAASPPSLISAHEQDTSVEKLQTKAPSSFPMFQTAGTKSVIKVSEESLSKVAKIFDTKNARLVAHSSRPLHLATMVHEI